MVKWFLQWQVRLTLALIALVAVLPIARNAVWRAIAERRIRARTGMDVRIGRFSSGWFSPIVTIKDLKLYNTPDFGGTLFLDIPELHVEMDAAALRRRQVRIIRARLNVAELDVVRNAAGRTNFTSLFDHGRPPSSGPRPPDKLLGGLEFRGIDELNLTLGKAKFIDLKDPARNREIDLGVRNQMVTNLNTDADVRSLLILLWLRTGGEFSMPPPNNVRPRIGLPVKSGP